MQMDLFVELHDDNNMIFKTNELLFYRRLHVILISRNWRSIG